MDSSQLKNRTKKYSITILDLVEKLPNTISGRAVQIKLSEVALLLELIIERFAELEVIESL